MPLDLVIIGAPGHGLQALRKVLAGLSPKLEQAVVVVPQYGADEGAVLGELLRESFSVPLLEPFDKQTITPGRVYVARPGYHLLVEDGHFALSTEGPVWDSRPSIDVLIESAVANRSGRLTGMLLGEATRDGEQAMLRVRQQGGLVIQRAVEREAKGRKTAISTDAKAKTRESKGAGSEDGKSRAARSAPAKPKESTSRAAKSTTARSRSRKADGGIPDPRAGTVDDPGIPPGDRTFLLSEIAPFLMSRRR